MHPSRQTQGGVQPGQDTILSLRLRNKELEQERASQAATINILEKTLRTWTAEVEHLRAVNTRQESTMKAVLELYTALKHYKSLVSAIQVGQEATNMVRTLEMDLAKQIASRSEDTRRHNMLLKLRLADAESFYFTVEPLYKHPLYKHT